MRKDNALAFQVPSNRVLINANLAKYLNAVNVLPQILQHAKNAHILMYSAKMEIHASAQLEWLPSMAKTVLLVRTQIANLVTTPLSMFARAV